MEKNAYVSMCANACFIWTYEVTARGKRAKDNIKGPRVT